MSFEDRKSGIRLVGDLSWGSHICQFYRTGGDLIDILVPYFKAGLSHNEYCLWIVARPLSVGDALSALRRSIPRIDALVEKGQIDIVPSIRWPAGAGAGKAIVARLDRAILSGFDGLRLACNARPRKKGGAAFEAEGVDAIRRHNVVAVFAYPREKFDAIGVMEVVKNHECALVGDAGRWEVIEASEARVAKDALKRTEEKLASLMANMTEGFAYHRIVLDEKGRPSDYVFLEANRAFEKLTGLSAKDIIGRPVTKVLPGIEKDATDWIGRYGKVALTGEPVNFESHAEPLDRWYSVSAFSPHKGFFAVTFAEITERKRMEKALAEERERLAVTLHSIGDAVISTDPEGRVTMLNRVAEELTGWRTAEAAGRPLSEVFDIVNEVTGGRAEDPVRKVLEAGVIVGLANHTALVRRDGARVSIADSAAPIRGRGGAILGVVLVFRDVTAERHAEADLQRTMSRLTVVNRELNEFAHAVSHDLKAPLRAVASLADWLVADHRESLSEKGKEHLDLLSNRVKRMHRLVDDVLEYSRLGRVEGQAVEIDAREVVDGALEMVAAPPQVEIKIEGKMPLLRADPVRLQQVFQNLIGNAVKFMDKPGGVICVGCAREDGAFKFRVADNGPGIDKEHHERIFKMFQTLRPKDETDSTGIGLAIVKRIVEAAGGRIWVESRPGEGSTFYFTIPT